MMCTYTSIFLPFTQNKPVFNWFILYSSEERPNKNIIIRKIKHMHFIAFAKDKAVIINPQSINKTLIIFMFPPYSH